MLNNPLRPVFGILCVALAAGCAHAQSQAHGSLSPALARADTAALHRTLDSLASAHRGFVGYTVHNIDTGEQFSLNGDVTFPTASLIKVPILVTLYDLAAQGKFDLDGPLTMLDIDVVPGSGVLQFMHPGIELSVRDAANLMIILSDNTATNLLLDRVAMRRVWDKMEALGLPHTKVHSNTFQRFTSVAMDSSRKYGLGVSTPNEMARLFELIANGRAVNPQADSAMMDILANNADMEGLQRDINGLQVPHKTGAVDSARTECAMFPLQSRVVMCVFTKENLDTRWIVDNEPLVLMGKMGAAVVAAWPRKSESAP